MALLNYESAKGHFPPAYTTDADGKPLHSWRVLILPYLSEQMAYNQFDLTEPWDSPKNLNAAKYMPPAFACPSTSSANSSNTNYVVVVDQGTMFPPGGEGTKIAEITDGLANTVILVETGGSGIPWTSPDDISIAELQRLSPNHSGATMNAAYADGHVATQTMVTPSEVLIDDGQ